MNQGKKKRLVFISTAAKVLFCLGWMGLFIFRCPAQNNGANLNLQLNSRDNLILTVRGLQNHPEKKSILTVYISLSEVCMISQYYCRVLEEMALQPANSDVTFKGVFPNPFSTDSTIYGFQKERSLHYPLYRDPNGLFCAQNQVEVTPEVLMVDSNSKVVYRGRIDDFYFAIGRFRTKTNQHDLQKAIDQFLGGRKVSPVRVQPVGCTIDRRLWKKK